MKHYEYAAVATVVENGVEQVITIPLSFDNEEVGRALARQYLTDTGYEKANPDRFIRGYRVVRRSVGEWEEWNGED